MKCREGCGGERTSAEIVCMKCWHRLPQMMRLSVLYTATVEQQAKIESEIRDWLATDDKRRG